MNIILVLQSTFYSYKNIIEPNPSSEQLFNINGNKTITLSFPLNNNYFAYIIGIQGNGIINIFLFFSILFHFHNDYLGIKAL